MTFSYVIVNNNYVVSVCYFALKTVRIFVDVICFTTRGKIELYSFVHSKYCYLTVINRIALPVKNTKNFILIWAKRASVRSRASKQSLKVNEDMSQYNIVLLMMMMRRITCNNDDGELNPNYNLFRTITAKPRSIARCEEMWCKR